MEMKHVKLMIMTLATVLLTSSVRGTMEADAFPGWMGDSHHSEPYDRTTLYSRKNSKAPKIRGASVSSTLNPHESIRTGGTVGTGSTTVDPERIIQLSWKPRAFLYKGFLSHEECDHLKALALPKLEKSMVTDSVSGKPVDSDIRTSKGMFITSRDDITTAIEDRIAKWTFLPKENAEAFQVLRYQKGQKYSAHYDYFFDPANSQMGGHRYATVLMYLADVESGGETVFPNAKDSTFKDDSWSECGKGGLAVKPREGDALLFFSLSPNAQPDTNSLHTACPVLEGVKWSATKWIHVEAFEPKRQNSGECENQDPRCEEWASAGECRNNPTFMIGEGEYWGSCRKACRVCGKGSVRARVSH